jgi:hypothetical protein
MKTDTLLKASDPRLPEIIQRLKEGKTNLLQESRGLGYAHNGPVRRALRELIGVDGFKELMRGRIKPKKKKRCSPVPASREGSQ